MVSIHVGGGGGGDDYYQANSKKLTVKNYSFFQEMLLGWSGFSSNLLQTYYNATKGLNIYQNLCMKTVQRRCLS